MSAHEEIRQVIAGQAQLRDDDDIDGWIANWSDDGAFVSGETRHVGKDAIRALADKLTTNTWRSLHLLSEPVIHVSGEAAEASTDFVAVAPDGSGALRIVVVARYRDTFRQAGPGRWLFQSREVEIRAADPALSTATPTSSR
jgi:hypothetical protein